MSEVWGRCPALQKRWRTTAVQDAAATPHESQDSNSASEAINRQFFGAVRAEDEDALDVAGAAGAGDERNEAGEIRRVFLLQQFKSGGQVGKQLFAPGDDDVMRRQDGYGASARAAAGNEDAASL